MTVGLKRLSGRKCSVMIQRSWVRNPVVLNLWVCSPSVWIGLKQTNKILFPYLSQLANASFINHLLSVSPAQLWQEILMPSKYENMWEKLSIVWIHNSHDQKHWLLQLWITKEIQTRPATVSHLDRTSALVHTICLHCNASILWTHKSLDINS